jgi:hypothetical protein
MSYQDPQATITPPVLPPTFPSPILPLVHSPPVATPAHGDQRLCPAPAAYLPACLPAGLLACIPHKCKPIHTQGAPGGGLSAAAVLSSYATFPYAQALPLLALDALGAFALLLQARRALCVHACAPMSSRCRFTGVGGQQGS